MQSAEQGQGINRLNRAGSSRQQAAGRQQAGRWTGKKEDDHYTKAEVRIGSERGLVQERDKAGKAGVGAAKKREQRRSSSLSRP